MEVVTIAFSRLFTQKGDSIMECTRCQGLMLEDQLLDMEEGGDGEMWASSWRCVNCGHAHDAVFERNRRAHAEKASVLSRGEPDYQEDRIAA